MKGRRSVGKWLVVLGLVLIGSAAASSALVLALMDTQYGTPYALVGAFALAAVALAAFVFGAIYTRRNLDDKAAPVADWYVYAVFIALIAVYLLFEVTVI